MDILGKIDDTLRHAGPDRHFGDEYWRPVDNRPLSCENCGHSIEAAEASTGYTHVGTWQGVRCYGMLCGATPAGEPS